MAISNEDKKDVKNAMGKALANKVANATRDGSRKLSVTPGASTGRTHHFLKKETEHRGGGDNVARYKYVPNGGSYKK